MKLGAAGAQVIRVAATAAPPGLDLPAVLHALSEKGITRLMVEGGARVASSFVAAGLVDEVWLLRGPEEHRRRRHSPRWTHCRCRLLTRVAGLQNTC